MGSRKRVRFNEDASEIQPASTAPGRSDLGRGVPFDPEASDQVGGEELNPGSTSLAEEEDGRALTAFNLREELEDGYVDRSGNFVSKALGRPKQDIDSSSDEDAQKKPIKKDKEVAIPQKDAWSDDEDDGQHAGAEKDAWADSLQTKAVYTSVTEGRAQKRRRAAADGPVGPSTDIQQATGDLYSILEAEERVSDALRRLGKRESAGFNPGLFERVTELADLLLNHGHPGIFQERREALQVLWELRWGAEAEIQGPFTSEAMGAWLTAGYFNANAEREASARVYGQGGDFQPAYKLSFASENK